MGMTYKRAWLLLDSINQAFVEAVVIAAPGGSAGGASLTPLGTDILKRYRRILSKATTVAANDLAALKARARPKIGPKV